MPGKLSSTHTSLAVHSTLVGQRLKGRYQVVDRLGRGGFGELYLARDIEQPDHPLCVIKHFNPLHPVQDLNDAKRLFQREAETLKKLGHHDQIPRLFAHFEENQQFYLVQEYIEGHPLSDELKQGDRWTEVQVAQLLWDVLSILEFVHAQGVIHRDIKPDNIIRRQLDNQLVLIDFGAVKTSDKRKYAAG